MEGSDVDVRLGTLYIGASVKSRVGAMRPVVQD